MPKCNGGNDGSITVSASGGTPPYRYSNDGRRNYSSNQPVRLAASSSVVPQGFTFTGLSAGTYPIKVKDANECTTEVQSVMVEVLSRVAGMATFEVLDVTGRARQSRRQELAEGLNEVKFGLSTLPTGIYLIRAVDALGQQGVVRVSKQ